MPLPARVFIAFPAVTQLLTSGAALNASSSTTMCGPPAWKATGISRPIAADGTISVSTAALAVGAAAVHSPAASTTVTIARINPRICNPTSRSVGLSPPQGSEPHSPAREEHKQTPERGSPETTDGGDPQGDLRRH